MQSVRKQAAGQVREHDRRRRHGREPTRAQPNGRNHGHHKRRLVLADPARRRQRRRRGQLADGRRDTTAAGQQRLRAVWLRWPATELSEHDAGELFNWAEPAGRRPMQNIIRSRAAIVRRSKVGGARRAAGRPKKYRHPSGRAARLAARSRTDAADWRPVGQSAPERRRIPRRPSSYRFRGVIGRRHCCAPPPKPRSTRRLADSSASWRRAGRMQARSRAALPPRRRQRRRALARSRPAAANLARSSFV
jgi:hypothetical protein